MNTSSDGFPIDGANASVAQAPIDLLLGPSSQASIPVPRVLVVCSSCTATLSIKRAYLGGAIQCKQCGHIFTVPAEAVSQPMPVAGRSGSEPAGLPRQADPGGGNRRAGVVDNVILDQLAQIITGSNELRVLHDGLVAEHNELKADRDAVVARLTSVSDLLEAMRSDLGPIAPADVRSIASEREELRALAERLREENRELAQRLDQSGTELQVARQERQQQSEQLTILRDELASVRGDLVRFSEERQAALLRCEELEDQNQGLVRAQASRELEHEAMHSAERSAQQQLAEEVVALRANAEETAKVAEQLISASLNQSDGPRPAAFELEAVRLQAEELRLKLDEANCLYRVMAETLDSFGIPIATLQEDQAFDCLDEPSSNNGHGQSHLGPGGVRSDLYSRR
jgi:hypothetical protein